MARCKQISEEERLRINRARDMKEMSSRVPYTNKPTRLFEVGEEVRYGCFKSSTIEEVCMDGMFYFLSVAPLNASKLSEDSRCAMWYDIHKLNSFKSEKRFSTPNIDRIQYSHSDIDSLIHKTYFSKTNFDPEYQRELVWTDEDKTALLESIFNNIDIGKFVFVKADYTKNGFDFDNDYFFEVLDGKQRLQCLIDFYEGRFAYKGVYFQDLCIQDANHFESYPIQFAEIPEPDDRHKVYEIFLRLNTFGKTIANKHLDFVCQLRDSE